MKPTEDPGVKEVQNRIISLANRALDEAMDILDYGTPQAKMQLITKFGGHMLRSLGMQDDDGIEGLRKDFLTLVKENKRGPVPQSGDQAGHSDEGGRARTA